MPDPFDKRRSYIPTPSKVQPNKPQNPAAEEVQPKGSEYSAEMEEESETSIIAREVI